MHLGLGPVFRFEWISTARNWRVYALRVVFELGLLLILWMVAVSEAENSPGIQTIQQQAQAGRAFSAAIVITERVRGSLDVLLTTTIPTRSIVWGKWWGTFRSMPMLAILPGILVVAAALFFDPNNSRVRFLGQAKPVDWWDGTRWLAVPLVVGLTIANGAALTSFGLVMATWISRLDRAVSATVSAYVFMVLVWPIAIVFIFSFNNNIEYMGLLSGSPFMGVAATGAAMVEHRRVVGIDPWKLQSAWAVFWILAYSTAAAFLLKLELARFDRKLGRTPDEGMLSRSRPVVVPDANELALSLAE